MIRFLRALTLCLSLLLGACKDEPGFLVHDYQEVKYGNLEDDIKIPTPAWEMLEFKGEGHEEIVSTTKNVIFSEVTVFLVQKNPGIVEGEAVKLVLPKGGGKIDLSRFITNQKGSFYVGFEFPAFEEAKNKKVLFVSGSRKRKIGGQVFGAGCNQFFDITDRFFKEMKTGGLKVNTTQERYLSVLGGTFLFSAQSNNDVHIAQVTFKSSQYSPLFCGGQ